MEREKRGCWNPWRFKAWVHKAPSKRIELQIWPQFGEVVAPGGLEGFFMTEVILWLYNPMNKILPVAIVFYLQNWLGYTMLN